MPEYLNIIDELSLRHLQIIPLYVLKNASDSYQMALIQPSGNVVFSDTYVKNDLANHAVEKFSDFLNKTYTENHELALSPEYSCPWEALQSSLNSNIFPSEGSIWILGCESISLTEIEQFKNANPFIEFVYESITPRSGRSFVSPVCYLFNAKDSSNVTKKIITIQFKTLHMHDPIVELEKDHLIYGTKRYWICNDFNSIQLSALICADSLHTAPIPFEDTKAYLILHLQLNPNPFNATFSQYRKNAFMRTLNIEIITLNWAKNFKIQGGHPSNSGGSAIYTKANKVNLTDNRINNNHQLGIYYSFEKNMKYHIYNLNYFEHIFYLKNSNVSQIADTALLASRTGVEAISSFVWDNSGWITTTTCDDEWNSYFSTRLPINLLPLEQSNPITKERFLSLTSGNLHATPEWASPAHLNSFNVENDSGCNHFSVYNAPIDKTSVRHQINNAINLNQNIVNNPDSNFPLKFQELYQNCKLVAIDDQKLCQFNIYKIDDKFPATFIYAGNISEIECQKIFDKAAKALECSKRRLVVWYEDSFTNTIKYICDEHTPKIDENCLTSSIAIDKEDN